MHTGQLYASGDWLVEEGRQEEFEVQWTEFTTWSRDNAPGSHSFTLLRDAADPRHYISFAGWDGEASITAWRNSPEFAELLGRCRAVCEQFQGRDLSVARYVPERETDRAGSMS